jgi:hypothetical protein
MLENIQEVIHLINKRFPEAIRLQKPARGIDRNPIAHFFRPSPKSLNLLTLHVDYSRETWVLITYECPSENEYNEFLNLWIKWGLFTNIRQWNHEEINLIE